MKKLIAAVLAVILLAGCSTETKPTIQQYRLEMKQLLVTLLTQEDRLHATAQNATELTQVNENTKKAYDETVGLVDKVKVVKLPSNFSDDFTKQHKDIVKMFEGYMKFYYMSYQYGLTNDQGTLKEATRVANETADTRDRAIQLINNILGADVDGNYKP